MLTVRSLPSSFAAAFALLSLAASPAAAGPAGGVTGAQQKESLQRIVLVCQNEPWVECPAHPSDPGYTITGSQCGRVFHSLCDPGAPCVPLVEERSAGTLRVSAQETPAPGTCSIEPCIDLEIDTELALDGPGAITLDQQFRLDGFRRSTDCRDNVSSGGLRISDWFPFRSRDCVFSEGINFEGMLVPTNSGNSYNQLSELEETLIRHAQKKAGLDACEALPTSMLDFASGGTCNGSTVQAGNALVLGAPSLPPLGQYLQRTVSYPVSVRFARRRPASLSDPPQQILGRTTTSDFGIDVDVDGDLLAVGDTTSTGQVRVFRRSGTNWTLEKTIFGTNLQRCFGRHVAISDSSTGAGTLIIGEACSDTGEGRAHVYRRFINFLGHWDWTGVTLTAPDSQVDDGFGAYVAIDGPVAVVGSPRDFFDDADSVYVYRLGSSWTLEQQIDVPNTGANVAVSGDVLVVGAFQATVAGQSAAGALYVYRHTNGQWVPEAPVVAASPYAGEGLGGTLAFDGVRVAAGTKYGERRVHVFRRDGPNTWETEAVLHPLSGGDDSYGWGVDVKGSWVVVGAPFTSVAGVLSAGSAQVYRFDGSEWDNLTGLSAPVKTAGGYFGFDVAVSDGHIVAGVPAFGSTAKLGVIQVYAINESCNYENLPAPCADGVTEAKISAPPGAANFGSTLAADGGAAIVGAAPTGYVDDGTAWIYRSDGLLWNLEQQLGPAISPNGNFGSRVALSGDTALVGEPLRGLQYEGSGLVYHREGGAWSLEQDLKAPTPQFFGLFGSVAVSGDVAIAGTADPVVGGQGAVYVFRREGGWQFEDTLRSFGVAPSDDDFGTALALSGNVALIGALGDGAAYVYRYRTSDSAWIDEQRLAAPPGVSGFGSAVAISGDVALVGASSFSGIFSAIGAAGAGRAFVFRFDPATQSWTEEQELVASDASTGDEFGAALAVAGDLAVIGAPGAESRRGAAYIFRHDGIGWQEERRLIADDGATGDRFGASVAIADGEVLIGAPEGNAVYAFRLPPTSVISIEGAPAGGTVSGSINGPPWSVNTFQGQTAEDVAAGVAAAIGSLQEACSQGVSAKVRGTRVLVIGLAPDAIDVTSSDAGLEAHVQGECANGLDDDGDGLTDAADPGCAGAGDSSERSPLYACDDGLDNDGDGLIDYRVDGTGDPGCWSGASSTEAPQCNDGIDNDGDELIDLADPSCNGNPASALEMPSCGLGFELALLLPPLIWLRRRRHEGR